jgi:hypothetical protein
VIFDADEFVFEAPPSISRARRVLIKPTAGSTQGYPLNTSRNMLVNIIKGIRRISDADILILEGTSDGKPMAPVYQSLDYNFPRVLLLDVKDTTMVEVDNPLLKPLVMPTFLVPNVILSADYLISVTPLKIIAGQAALSIPNLLSLLSGARQSVEALGDWEVLIAQDKNRVLADLYYTMPFDLGIIEAEKKLVSKTEAGKGEAEYYGKVFVGEPYHVDKEVSQALGIKMEYLKLIDEARVDLEA